MRQPVEAEEGRAALEVDQDEVQHLGGVRDGERQHQRAQQLGLSGAGGADQHPVRAHAALRGLLDVQLDGRAVGGEPERHPQPVGDAAPGPGLGDVVPVQVGDAEQGGEVEVGVERLADVGGGADPVRRQQRGRPAGGGHRQAVGTAERGVLVPVVAVGADHGQRVALDQ